jgi:hypothetical protein
LHDELERGNDDQQWCDEMKNEDGKNVRKKRAEWSAGKEDDSEDKRQKEYRRADFGKRKKKLQTMEQSGDVEEGYRRAKGENNLE